MIVCPACQLLTESYDASDHTSTYAFGKHRWEQPFEKQSFHTLRGALQSPPTSPPLGPYRPMMRSEKDHTQAHHPRSAQPMVIAGLPERWYDRMNQKGPNAPSIPFVDDDPPFYLQKPLSDEESIPAAQADRMSSRPGQSSQLPPLSHSLLSQLELGEYDPNTFREIIDDLTVENKNLKRQLRRYKQMDAISTQHDGLFEVRTRRLPVAKKQELETILQNFASTVQISSRGPATTAVISGDVPPTGTSVVEERPISSEPPHGNLGDAAHASTSTAGRMVEQMSGPLERTQLRTHQELPSRRRHTPHTTALGNGSASNSTEFAETSDRFKQDMIVKRLELLFSEEHTGTVTSDKRKGRYEASRPLNRKSTRSDSSQEDTFSESPRPSQDRIVSSSIASTSLPENAQWVYLNLLINMAELHSLNVTPDFVRRAIQDASSRLQLSQDGSKVMWQGDYEHIVGGPDRSIVDPTSGYPRAADGESVRSDHETQSASNGSLDCHRIPGAEDTGHFVRAQTVTPLVPRSQSRKRLPPYKPLFAHSKQRHGKPKRSSDDDSCDSSNPSSDSEVAPTGSHASTRGPQPSNGPLIFFGQTSFFLDLGAGTTNVDHSTQSSYPSYTTQPLGANQLAQSSSQTHEPRQNPRFGTHWRDTPRRRDDSTNDGPSSLLRIYNGTSGPKNETFEDIAPLGLEASGIGGIQLEDNIAITVETSHKATPSELEPYVRRPSPRNRLHHIIHSSSFAPHHRPRGSTTRSPLDQILSTRTTQLPPSPLPPPSYMYPAPSSSSSESEDGHDSLDSIYSDSDSEHEFRQVSLSPQMRMFLESPEPPLHPDNGAFMDTESISSSSDEDGGIDA